MGGEVLGPYQWVVRSLDLPVGGEVLGPTSGWGGPWTYQWMGRPLDLPVGGEALGPTSGWGGPWTYQWVVRSLVWLCSVWLVFVLRDGLVSEGQT